jgi:hypothetical protein
MQNGGKIEKDNIAYSGCVGFIPYIVMHFRACARG